MNKEQLTSIVRQVLLFIGGFLVGKGLISAETLQYLDANVITGIAGVIVSGIASIWALKDRSDKSIVTSAAEKVPIPAPAQKEVGITEPVRAKT